MAYLALDTPVPLAEVFRGVQEVYRHTQAGHSNYIFGKVRQTGVFYYYPALLVFSVPVGLLALSVLGAFGLKRAAGGGDALTHWAMLAVAAAVSLVNVFSSINIGFRHGLVLYPFVCLVGAVGCAGLWRRRRLRAGARLLAVALVGQHLVSSALAHPDYATYFNVLAGSKPEEICAMSREGGDEWRLASRLRQLGAQHVCLALGPPLPLDVLGLPPYTLVHRNTPCQGWVAVGQNRYFVDLGHSDPGIEWLAQYQPVERIGTSILLYRTR
jgi:hypothetical protein